jgi:hypothetical protein
MIRRGNDATRRHGLNRDQTRWGAAHRVANTVGGTGRVPLRRYPRGKASMRPKTLQASGCRIDLCSKRECNRVRPPGVSRKCLHSTYLAGTGCVDPGRSTTPADTAAASGTWTPLGTRTPANTDPSTPRRTGPMQIHTDQLRTPAAVPGNAAVTATKRHGTQHAGRLETGSYTQTGRNTRARRPHLHPQYAVRPRAALGLPRALVWGRVRGPRGVVALAHTPRPPGPGRTVERPSVGSAGIPATRLGLTRRRSLGAVEAGRARAVAVRIT